jgi:hypothetical protein
MRLQQVRSKWERLRTAAFAVVKRESISVVVAAACATASQSHLCRSPGFDRPGPPIKVDASTFGSFLTGVRL